MLGGTMAPKTHAFRTCACDLLWEIIFADAMKDLQMRRPWVIRAALRPMTGVLTKEERTHLAGRAVCRGAEGGDSTDTSQGGPGPSGKEGRIFPWRQEGVRSCRHLLSDFQAL